jgi:hypothetical protein
MKNMSSGRKKKVLCVLIHRKELIICSTGKFHILCFTYFLVVYGNDIPSDRHLHLAAHKEA